MPPERDEAKNMQINPPALHCVTPEVIRLSTAQPWQKSVFYVATRGTKLETVDQVEGDQEDKVKMVTLCSVVK